METNHMRSVLRSPIKHFSIFLFLALPLAAQEDRPVRYHNTDPAGACSVITPVWNNWLLGKVFQCVGASKTVNVGSWVQLGAGMGVTSFKARTGVVVPATGDYTAAQVTNAVDQTGSYANPAWITSLAWVKLTGVPPLGGSVFTGSTGTAAGNCGATPAFSLADVSVKSPTRFECTVNVAITAITFTNKTAGAKFSVKYLQDGTGHAVAYAGGAVNVCAVSITADKYTLQEFEVGADGTTVQGSLCTSDDPQAIPTTDGGTGLTTATDDTIAIYNGTGADQKAIPNCIDTGGQHLNYTAASNALSCGNSGSGSGSHSLQFPAPGFMVQNGTSNGWALADLTGLSDSGTVGGDGGWLLWDSSSAGANIIAQGRIPADWAGGTVTAAIQMMSITGSAATQFTLETLCYGNNSTSGASYNAAQNFSNPGTTIGNFYTLTIASVTKTGCNAGDGFRARLKRSDSNATERFFWMELKF